MQFDATLSALFWALLGFVFVVMALHLGECAIRASRCGWWLLSLGCWAGVLLVLLAVVLLVVAHWHTEMMSNLLLALGGQFALFICVPSRVLALCLARKRMAQLMAGRVGRTGASFVSPYGPYGPSVQPSQQPQQARQARQQGVSGYGGMTWQPTQTAQNPQNLQAMQAPQPPGRFRLPWFGGGVRL